MYPEPFPFLAHLPANANPGSRQSAHLLPHSHQHQSSAFSDMFAPIPISSFLDDQLASAHVNANAPTDGPSSGSGDPYCSSDLGLGRLQAVLQSVSGSSDASLARLVPADHQNHNHHNHNHLDNDNDDPRSRAEMVLSNRFADGINPDISFLDAQIQELAGDRETSFTHHANFPWATPLNLPPTQAQAQAQAQAPQPSRSPRLRARAGPDDGASAGSSLARGVGVIAL